MSDESLPVEQQPLVNADQAYEVLQDRKAGITENEYDSRGNVVVERKNLTIEGALEQLKERREARLEAKTLETDLAEQTAAQQAAIEQQQHAADQEQAPQWSNEDLKILGALRDQGQQIQLAAQQQLAAEDEFNKRFGGASLEHLRENDPAQWAQITTHQRQLLKSREQIVAAVEQHKGQLAEVSQNVKKRQDVAKYKAEYARMIEKEPDLEKPEVRQQVRKHLLGRGYTANEIDGCLDHRLIVDALRTMRAENPQPRKVAKYRKTQKRTQKNDPVVQAHAKLKRTGKMEDARKLLEARAQNQ